LSTRTGGVFDDWSNPTRTTCDDPRTIEAVEWYAKLFHEHRVAPTRTQARKMFAGDPRGWYGFVLHKVGMIVAGPDDRFPSVGGGKAVRRGVVTLPRGR
jgi:hypothetical protein